MKNRKQKQMISLLLLILISTAMVGPAHTEAKATVREILTEMGELVPAQNSAYLLAKERKGTLWGVYNTDGDELIPFTYPSLSYLSYNCFSAGKYAFVPQNDANAASMEIINSYALVTVDGTRVSDFLYGAFKVFSTYWACGWILEKGTKNDYDYRAGSSYYRIQRCDFYYLGDHALAGKQGTEQIPPCLSLTRDEYKNARGHGKYLYVQDRQDEFKVFDSTLQLMNVQVKKLNEAMYVIKNWAVMPRETSEILLDGFSAVKEVSTDAGLLLIVTRLDYSGKKWYTVYTLDGEQLMPMIETEISTATPDYAVLTLNKKQGLYSIREKRELLPCAYDKVISNTSSLDPYLMHGYACVENDGARYFIHLDSGAVFESAALVGKWKNIGCTYYLNDGANSRYRILAPDQTEHKVDDSKLVQGKNRGSGYLLSFTSVLYKNMIVNWYGEPLMKFSDNPFAITSDDKVIVETMSNGYKLIEIMTEENP